MNLQEIAQTHSNIAKTLQSAHTELERLRRREEHLKRLLVILVERAPHKEINYSKHEYESAEAGRLAEAPNVLDLVSF